MVGRKWLGWVILGAASVFTVILLARDPDGWQVVGAVLLFLLGFYKGRRFQWRVERGGYHNAPRFWQIGNEERAALARERAARNLETAKRYAGQA